MELENNVVQPNADTAKVTPAQPEVANQGSVSEKNPDDYDFRINENGDIEISDDFFGLDNASGQQPESNPVANNSESVQNVQNPDGTVPPEQKSNYYTEDEIGNLGLDHIDPNRLPPQLVPFYRSMQADYTRKTQAVAQEKKDLEARLNSMNVQPQPQNPPFNANQNPLIPQGNFQNGQQVPLVQPQQPQQSQQPPQADYYKQLYDVAIKNVEKKLGSEFNELDPLHLTALSSEVAQIQNQIERTHSKKQELDAVVSKYVSDPRWSEMQTYVDKVLDSMPYNESKQIRDRIESGDIQYIDGFLKTARECFYETNGGTKVPTPQQANVAPQPPRPVIKPPVLEGGGVGVSAAPASSSVDLSKLGSMTNDELANLFVDMGFTK